MLGNNRLGYLHRNVPAVAATPLPSGANSVSTACASASRLCLLDLSQNQQAAEAWDEVLEGGQIPMWKRDGRCALLDTHPSKTCVNFLVAFSYCHHFSSNALLSVFIDNPIASPCIVMLNICV